MAQNLATAFPPVIRRDVRLPVEIFPPSMWADTSFSTGEIDQEQESYAKATEEIKEEVRKMLISGGKNILDHDKLVLIDTLERLGVAYHFKQEIEEQLQHMSNFDSENQDLFTIALRFRLLRQHHRRVSSSVFDKFKGKDEKLDEEMLSGDAKGLLSLYEAAQVRIHGEDILEESAAFTRHHLNLMAPTLKCRLGDQVKQALNQPLHRIFSRVETRDYISFYGTDFSHNEMLLELAKLDYAYVQNLYKKELQDLCQWWANIDNSKFSYARDRVPELYFWALSIYFEPDESFVRIAATKFTLIASILDDTYDNYATVDEAETFTEIIQRWDLNELHRLPDYMKAVYKFILNTYEEFVDDLSERGRTFAAPYVREAIKELSRHYYEELKWFMGMEVPTFEVCESIRVVTSTAYLLILPALSGMKSVSDQVFEWLITKPKLLVASALIGRYRDDLASHMREGREGQMLTSITSYMKQYEVTKEVALKRYAEMIEDAWKDIYAEWENLPSIITHEVADVVVNFARTSEFVYQTFVDGYTYPENIIAPQIVNLIIDPITI